MADRGPIILDLLKKGRLKFIAPRGHPLALMSRGQKHLRPNLDWFVSRTCGPELQARFDPVISVARFWIPSLEGIRSVIHLVLALRSSGLLLHSCRRELPPAASPTPVTGHPENIQCRAVSIHVLCFSSSEATAGFGQPLPGSQRGRITLNSIPHVRMCGDQPQNTSEPKKGRQQLSQRSLSGSSFPASSF